MFVQSEKFVESHGGKFGDIAVDLYNALIALRPDWGSAKDDAEAEKGKPCVVKVMMTGSADDGHDWFQTGSTLARRSEACARLRLSWITGRSRPHRPRRNWVHQTVPTTGGSFWWAGRHLSPTGTGAARRRRGPWHIRLRA